MRAVLHRIVLLGFFVLFSALSCAAPPEQELFAALEAPSPSPPGHLSLSERITWWEDRLWKLTPEDLSEARLRLGQLYMEAERPESARRSFREALYGRLSREEIAQAEYGIGLAYLLEEEPELARDHLRAALDGLSGPQRQECDYLYQTVRGMEPSGDAVLAVRVSPYLRWRDRASANVPVVTRESFLAPEIEVSRASWMAQPVRGNHEPMTPPTRITVHHSAEPIRSASLAATKAEVRRIQQIHQDTNHWADIGYHFLIDRAGRVIEGRPIQYQGAHAFGDNNVANIGVCLLGNFVAQPDRGPEYALAQEPTFEQYRALEDLVESLRVRYRIDPRQLHYHSEFRDTECPGPQLRAWVLEYRS